MLCSRSGVGTSRGRDVVIAGTVSEGLASLDLAPDS